MQEFIKINREDTVAVALKPLPKGSTVETDQNTVVLKEDIPQGHKFAVCQMPEGAPVIKYGWPYRICLPADPARGLGAYP